MKFISVFLISISCFLNVFAALAQSYSVETRERVAQFPNDGGTLDWRDLSDELQPPDDSTAFEDVYTSVLIVLRTDRSEHLQEILNAAREKAESRTQIAKIRLIDEFLQFYLYRPEDRTELFAEVLSRLEELESLGSTVDWMTGTTISALNEHALQIRDLSLAEQTSAKAEYLFSRQPNVETAIWSANLNLKAVYAAMPSPAPQAHDKVDRLLSRTTNFLSVAYRQDTDQSYTDEISGLYFRSVALNLYLTSKLRAADKHADSRQFRMIRDLHPNFETECVVDLKNSRKKIKGRILSGTGGVLLRLAINKKGRAKFLRVEDAVPARLAHEKMHRSYRTMANELRVTVKDSPACQDGGEILRPISISGDS